ncbi:MAG TPA: heparinase II/III family protein, partial [Thermomicrobiales bacterium]
SLLGTLAPEAPLQGAAEAGLSRTLRDLLWWDGERQAAPPLADALLPASGIARLTARTEAGAPIALAIKAGHNDEHHNHNDIGSFVLHVADETLLADPGPGRYERDYFNERRYESPFANSLGHSVPRIAGRLQGTGRAFAGALTIGANDAPTSSKTATVEFARAYPVAHLTTARRTLTLTAAGDDSTVLLHDRFAFTGAGEEVEEALVTWLPVTLAGATATIHGQRHDLTLTIEAPTGAQFAITAIAHEGKGDTDVAILHRLGFTIPPATSSEARIRMMLRARQGRVGNPPGRGGLVTRRADDGADIAIGHHTPEAPDSVGTGDTGRVGNTPLPACHTGRHHMCRRR